MMMSGNSNRNTGTKNKAYHGGRYMKRKQYQTLRILADELKISNDSWKTGLNNNYLIIGVSGAGKTRGYVEPNLLANKGSIVVTDTKGNLCGKYRKALENRGFQVKQLDFTDCEGSVGYNPLDYIHYDEKRGKYKELDIMRVAAAIIPDTDTREPFWYIAARAYIEFAIAFVLEVFPKEMHTMEWVNKLIGAASASSPEKKLTDEGEQQASEFREELIKWTEDTSVEPGEWLAESVRKCQNALQPWQLSEIMDDLKNDRIQIAAQ